MATPNITVSSVNMAERKALQFNSGDTVRVFVKVEEKGKIRLQAFEGLVLARKGGSEAGATFTVRRVAGGHGVEKIFPLYSPAIDRIEIVRKVRNRRSKLYHLRDIAARDIRRQMRKIQDLPSMPEIVEEAPEAPAEDEASADETSENTPEVAETSEPVSEEKTDDVPAEVPLVGTEEGASTEEKS